MNAKQKFEAAPSPAIPCVAYGQVRSQFALAITLYHSWSLLSSYGFRAAKNHLSDLKEEVQGGAKDVSKSKKALINMPQFNNLLLMLEEFADAGGYNHPKLQKLQELLLEHFRALPPGFCYEARHSSSLQNEIQEAIRE